MHIIILPHRCEHYVIILCVSFLYGCIGILCALGPLRIFKIVILSITMVPPMCPVSKHHSLCALQVCF